MEGWKIFEGKKVFVILKNKRQYSGTVDLVDYTSEPSVFLFITDKYGNAITIASTEIEVIQEEK